MRDYQRKKTKYILPKAVYYTVLWKVRDYYRCKEMANDLIEEKKEVAGSGCSTQINDKVAKTAIRREALLKEVRIIEEALKEIPEEYRIAIWNNIQFRQPYPLNADRSTYGRYKSKFIFLVAQKFNLL